MAIVYLGLGSNVRPEENLRLAVMELRNRFSLRDLSAVYKSKSLGFDGDDFLNAVACIETEISAHALCAVLDDIHDLASRQRQSARFSARTLDIDLLLYGDLVLDDAPVRVPRSDVITYSFVLCPLAEIAADLVHPVSGKTILEHWLEFDHASHRLTKDSFTLREFLNS